MKKVFPWQILLNWYEKNGKHDFPWREYGEKEKVESGKGDTTEIDNALYFILYTLPYKVWLAEILLQQTQADRVVPFYTRILERYPTIHELANTTYDEFFLYYQGLGYYSRARNLLKAAKIVSEEYQGIFPRDKQKLRKLPGIGEYTARAILAFGYGEPLLAWDTNLETIFSRYYKGAKNINLTQAEKDEIEGDFRDFIASRKAQEQQMGVRGEDTVKNFRKKISSDDENNNMMSDATPGASLSTLDAFDTFGSKSMEETVSEKKNSERNLSSSTDIPSTRDRDDKKIIRNINNALMDWARIMEPKTSSLLEKEKYIFTESEFYITNGSNEIIEKKKTEYFPIPDAQVIVTLHENHKIYYSLSDDTYSPFTLPPTEDRDTRKYVQDYFRSHYNLELSVRPIHKKWITEDGKPYIAVNAQVQAGKHDFRIFDKITKELQEKNK